MKSEKVSCRVGSNLLTVTAASTAPAIPPENRDNAGDILCLTTGAGLGLCLFPIGLSNSTPCLAVGVMDAIVNNDSSIVYFVDFFSEREFSKP